jgi:TonB-linked SusC/RagA family outer membrane protein
MKRFARIPRSGTLLSILGFFLILSSFNVLAGVRQANPVYTVTGKITSARTGEPLQGATVSVEGTSNTVTADAEGLFSINVNSKKADLLISFSGFNIQKVPVTESKFIQVALVEDAGKLNEVIVVGYGRQTKNKVTGAVATVKGEEITKSNAGDLTNSLAGRIPGVVTMQNSAEPGSDAAQVFIRGRATLNDNNPLVMVDGIQRDFNQIDPNEIESISVLKDASAVAIYGVRGGNGVILITTKRGTTGKPTFNYTGYYGIQNPTQIPKYLNSYDYARLYNEAQLNDDPTATPPYSDEDLQKYKDHSDPYDHPDVNWFKEVITPNAPQMRHSLSVTGGSDKIKYFMLFGVFDQTGMYKTVDFKKYNLRVNVDAELSKTTSLSVGVYGSLQRKQEPGVPDASRQGEGLYAVITYIPNNAFPVRNEDGSLGSIWGQSPIGEIYESGYIRKNSNDLQSSFAINQKLDFITKGLSAKVVYAKDLGYNHNKSWLISYKSYSRSGGDLEQQLNRSAPSLEENFGEYENSTFETHINYNRNFGKHQVGALVLYSQSEFFNNGFSAFRREYLTTAVDQLSAGPDANKDNGSNAGESGVEGIVGRFNYAFDQKYLFEASFGYNGSDNFPRNKRFGFFPAVAAGWVISREPFFESATSLITNLKIRGSYGQVGNDKVGSRRFLYIPTVNYSGGYVIGGQPVQGVELGDPANLFVTWERAKKSNIGIDMDIKGSMLSVRGDIFYEQRSNILGTRNRSVPGTYGFSLPVENFAKVNNRGFEIEVNHSGSIGLFSYSAGFNITHARNKVVFIDEPANIPAYRQQTGHPLEQFFGFIAEGFYNDKTELDTRAKIEGAEPQLGDIKYKDINNDGVIDEDDITAIGKSDIPENVLGLNLGANYKGLDFSALFQGATGYTVEYQAGVMEFIYNSQAWQHHLNRWTPDNHNASYPRLSLSQYNYKMESSTFWANDAGYVRLKNIELGYTFPNKLFPNSSISKLRIYLSATNLFTISKVKYFDPEAPSGFPLFYPQQKGVFGGVNLTF